MVKPKSNALAFCFVSCVIVVVRIQLTKLVLLSWALGIPADGIVIAAALSTQVRSWREVEWKLWSTSLRFVISFSYVVCWTIFFGPFCLPLDWKRSQGCFQDGSSSELPEFGGPTCRRFPDEDLMPCAARTFHDTCRRTTSLGLVLMVDNFRNPLCDLSCGKIYEHFKTRVSVNLCALNLLGLQILLFGSPLRSCRFLQHFPEMFFTFQVS